MEVNTVLIDMPTKIKGYTVKNSDDSYSIFLNARISRDCLLKTYEHEMEHIQNEDFEKENVDAIEKNAHASGGEDE